MKMRFTVGLGRNERIYEIAGISKTAEDSRFTHLTFIDSQNLSRDTYVAMTIAAASTHRILVGQGVTIPFTRHPSVTANATATLDELSGGRVFLGFGAGGSALTTMGMNPRTMNEFKEAVQFIRKYMKGEEANYKGAKMHSEWVRKSVPIYIASTGPRSLQLSGELADGIIFPGTTHPVIIKWNLEQIEKGALKARRDISEIDTVLRTFVYVTKSPEEAVTEAYSYAASASRHIYSYLISGHQGVPELARRLERAEPGIIEEFRLINEAWDEYAHQIASAPHASFVTQRIIRFFHLVGTADDIGERIIRLGELGITNISTGIHTVADKKGILREIGDSVIRHFKR